VNLLFEGKYEYLEIIVDKYPSLISYRGKYYYRSGSTMRTITGVELDKALLQRHGLTWDSVPIPRVTANDMKQAAVDLFKEKAVASDRLTAEDVDVDNYLLLENLRLYDEGSLIRAAIMAFHRDPEKWIGGAYIKIGFFVTDADLRYQDEIHGSLIEQIDKTEDLVYTKYMKALIDYEGIQRIEKYMFPRTAFREILLNAVVHKDYSRCNPIQISVYEDKMYVYNDGIMPEELSSAEKLFEKHSSNPFNPKLAGVFFKSGMIEAWGRGFEKIREACESHGTILPDYKITSYGVMVLCKPNERYMKLLRGDNVVYSTEDKFRGEFVDEFVVKFVDNEVHRKIIILMNKQPKISASAIAEHIGMTSRGVQKNIDVLKKAGLIERIGPPKGGSWVVKKGANQFEGSS
jgi:ATP-dependent DNA helicase RecG